MLTNKQGQSPVQTKVAAFYEALSEGKILASRCTKCNAIFLPPRADCSNCYSSEMNWEQFERSEGKLLTFTTIYFAPESVQNQAPYSVGVVQLDNGIKVTGTLSDPKAADYITGDRVKIVPYNTQDRRWGFRIIKD